MKKLSINKPKFNLKISVLALTFGILTPIIVQYVPVLKARLIGVPLILMLVNLIFAVVLGLWIQRTHTSGFQVYIFPLAYMIVAYLVLPKYLFYFAPIYLMVTYLSWSMSEKKSKG